MARLVHITTVPESLGFVAGQVDFLRGQGWDVGVVSSPGRLLDDFAKKHGVDAYAVKMNRAITPGEDADAVMRVTDFLLDYNPDIVHSHTPKGGLVGMVAARAAMVPVRVYHMRGLLTATARGIKKTLFAQAERTSCNLAHAVVCQSPSLRQFAVESRLVKPLKAVVFRNGSNGIDALGRFNPDNVSGLDVRRELGIDEDDFVIGFVGRIVGDKGVPELVDAFRAVKGRHPNAHLIVVGPFETRDSVPDWVERALREDPNVHLVGFVRDLPRYYEAMDVVALPSHREGFPNVPLEAAAMAVPTVTTDAVGCVDAVVDGVTGTVVPVRDARRLAEALLRYAEDPGLRATHGAQARARVLEEFQPEHIHRASLELYEQLLHKYG